MRRAFPGFLALAAVAVALAAPSAGARNGQAVHYYLSLGDSLAAGYQPTLGQQNFGGDGYADQLYARELAEGQKLQLVKLGCGGETTGSMIDPLPYAGRSGRAFCRFPHGSQLAEAVSFLRAHRQFVSFVTIDIGANDALGGVPFPVVAQNLATVLTALREAAGPEVPIVGMNYYDPLLAAVWAETGSVAAVQAEVVGIVAFNDLLEAVYAAAGDPVADVETAFSTTSTALVGGVPFDVARICQWTWMCAGPPFGPDIHANTTGYGVIAEAFHTALTS